MNASNDRNNYNLSNEASLTNGQKEKIQTFISWAKRNSVEYSFSVLFNLSNTQLFLSGFVNFLHFIFENFDTLEQWSIGSDAASHLFKISEALQYDSSILNENRMPFEKPADIQLRGSLEQNYLLALVLTKPINVARSFKYSFNRLRLWILVEAYNRGLSDNYLDKLIYEVCTQLRLAKNGIGDVYECVAKLYLGHQDYESESRSISIYSNKLIQSNLEAQASKFLKNLIKIVNGDHSPFSKRIRQPIFQIDKPKVQVKPNSGHDSFVNNLDDEDPILGVSGSDDEDALFIIGVDSKKPFELQKLSSSSVLLSSIEQNQFLPWTWNTLNFYEFHVLRNEISTLISSIYHEQQLSGALLWCSLKLGRSIRRVLEIPISDIVQAEWILNIQAKQLQRLPPRRKSSWLPSNTTTAWIKPFCELNYIQIPEPIQKILFDCYAERNQAEYLWQLWHSSEHQNPIAWIDHYLEKCIPRFSQGKLNQVLPNQLFQHTKDYKFARTAASHPLTGLPPACAYASFTNLMPLVKDVAEFEPKQLNQTEINNEIVLFGALLNPIESLLIEEIHSAAIKLESVRKGQNLIQYHNQFSAYVYLMLLAATGARPINDLFESITQFDFLEHFVFIDDKSTSFGNKGRLSPLPIKLSRYLNVQYRAHLRLVADKLSATNNQLSMEIKKIVGGKSSERLPFLFLLSTDDLGGWKSITSSEFKDLKLFETPLPLNLFRHRLAKILSNNSVEPEIIDGLFGHIEYGSESYGDFSERIWIQDMSQIRNYIDRAFDDLQFSFIEHQPSLVLKNTINNSLFQEEVIFGSKARANARMKKIKNAIKVVREEIKDFLNNRTLDQLNESDIQKLGEKMAVSPSGIPRHDALLRYHYFERFIEKFCKRYGQSITIKKRYIAPVANSPFNEYAPNAIFTLNTLRHSFNLTLKKEELKKLDFQECAIYLILLLIFENKLTDINKLTQIATGKQSRILQLKNKYYMEYSPLDEINTPTQPVLRFLITPLIASLLLQLKSTNKRNVVDLKIGLPNSLIPLLNELNPHHENHNRSDTLFFITEIIRRTEQVNFMTMPSVVAGYLSGRTESWSLSLYDFVKIQTGKYVIFNQDVNNQEAEDQIITFKSEVSILTRSSNTLKKSDAHLYLQEIRSLLNAYDDNKDLVPSRRDFVNLLDKNLFQFQESVSVSLHLLGDWVKHLVEGHKRNKKDTYAISSVIRYFNALSPKFESLVYDQNILGMEEDEVTEFYRNLLLSTNKTARRYTGLRLYDFHRWAAQTFAMEDPDWSELPVLIKEVNVRPGIILENEYQQALLLLSKSSEVDQIYARSLACFLIFVYRFGLRSFEALGLQRQDVCNFDGLFVLLVQNNKIRELKNKQSRRQIPLLFKLSPLENQLIDAFLAYQEVSFANKTDTPLFFNNQHHLNKSERQVFKSYVLNVLKLVTGNPSTNIHHARHSAANRVSYHLHGLALPTWSKRHFSVVENTKEILLGIDQGSTRRSSWASARYMGHAVRATQYKSYIHYLDAWSNLYHEPLNMKVAAIHSKHIFILDDLPQCAAHSTRLLEKIETKRITPNTNILLKALILIGNGKTIDATASVMCVSSEILENLTNFVRHISNVLRALNPNLNDGLSILTKMTESGLQRLFDLTMAQDADSKNPLLQDRLLHISIEEIKTMIGINGQILMYEDHHFALVRTMLDYFAIPNSLFKVIKSNKSDEQFNDVAQDNGFTLVSQSDISAVSAYQLDPTWDANNHYHVEARCALAFDKNSIGFVRNRYELLILFALFVTLKMNIPYKNMDKNMDLN